MFELFQVIFSRTISIATTTLVGIGLMSSPVPVDQPINATSTQQNNEVVVTEITEDKTEVQPEGDITSTQQDKNQNKSEDVNNIDETVGEKSTSNKEAQNNTKDIVSTTSEDSEENITTFPSGAVVKLDDDGNIVEWIKRPPEKENEEVSEIRIFSVNTTSTKTSALIEWETNKPSESKVYISGGKFDSKAFISESGFDSNHKVSLEKLSPSVDYSYRITAVNEDGFASKLGEIETLDKFFLEVNPSKTSVEDDGIDYAYIYVTAKYTDGRVVSNKKLKFVSEWYEANKSTDEDGKVTFHTLDTSQYSNISSEIPFKIIDRETNEILYSGGVNIKSDQDNTGINDFTNDCIEGAACP